MALFIIGLLLWILTIVCIVSGLLNSSDYEVQVELFGFAGGFAAEVLALALGIIGRKCWYGIIGIIGVISLLVFVFVFLRNFHPM